MIFLKVCIHLISLTTLQPLEYEILPLPCGIITTIISCPLNFQLSEKGKPYVDIQGLTASTMEILLDFVYTETVHVTVENVQELLPAACLLQLKGTDVNIAIVHAKVDLEMFKLMV